MPTNLANGLLSLELARQGAEWQLAALASEQKKSGEWKQWVGPDGKRTSSFRRYVEKMTETMRDGRATGGVLLDMPSGRVLDLVKMYEWVTGLGFPIDVAAQIGLPRLKKLYAYAKGKSQEEQTELIGGYFTVLNQQGEAPPLPSDAPEEIKTELILESIDDDNDRLLGVRLYVNGVPFTNKWPTGKSRWLSVRLRARTVYTDREAFRRERLGDQ